ncbi:hypothetical protein ACL02T_10825 [Pseudonocardia sp. RS010]|uniref:hypothetical protein n=1 Tax=Pseudonocardia sp. RS010 TaxID=3385979 RepID=UPI0039A35F59
MTEPQGPPPPPTPGMGRVLWPTWERCEWCRAQLYIAPSITPRNPRLQGAWVPRDAPTQVLCPAAPADRATGRAGTEHRMDLEWARRFTGPRCDGQILLDGPGRPAIECPRRPVRRVTRHLPGPRPRTTARQGCHEHFPTLLSEAETDDQARRRLGHNDLPRLRVEQVELVVTNRDRAHGRSGRWESTLAEGPIQHQLF